MNLHTLGWNQHFEQHFTTFTDPSYIAGRVTLEHKRIYRVMTEKGELLAEITGKMRYQAFGREDFPAVGDWVVMTPRWDEKKATIHAILPRFSKFSRKVAGNALEEQIVAANVNTVFLVNALNLDFNLRRIERYLLVTWESGANPVIVLSKADLCEDIEAKIAEVESIAIGVPIYAISSVHNQGIEQLLPYVDPGQTVALLGSSGVGKSSLVNSLSNQHLQEVQEVRTGDDRGKHTTTHREMFLLPSGGLMIDTPGMRELQLWDADEGLSDTFTDIEELARNCRFFDCKHDTEPGCAIRSAIEEGSLPEERYKSYQKLQREMAFLARKESKQEQAAQKDRWKQITKSVRGVSKKK
ncbi:ribosome small subunit-dependent GTPase A [Brevibacillus daliensis]|uniref:ribosome small subunit-dependent GTPase A n=1 Tax=Brevibacillus daliensis TaxID=2892995 RepID=UPI001E5AA581|nr:ribosome small subunit-dependent GTPase A [Brevibacillus daliensis]